MKYIIILGDGMSDYPVPDLGGLTPLMAAHKPSVDELCRTGRTGRLVTVPPDMPPGSEVANMGVLGYDVKKVYEGRGVLEAASMGVNLSDDDLALRCNLVCIEKDILKNHSAGHISSDESHSLIKFLSDNLDVPGIKLYPGVSYRHLMVVPGGSSDITCTPPHDVPGTPFRDVMVKAGNGGRETADMLNRLIIRSQELLSNHPVNIKRMVEGKDPANSIWPWSPGHRPRMKTLYELYGITGAMISAVDLLYGIGAYAGMKAIKVEGSTGLYNTNYEGKAKAAVDALKDVDLVYLHIEASDEAGHEGDFELKKRTIEYLDSRVIKYILEKTAGMNDEVALALLPDHPTPCSIRTHTHDPVPFIIRRPGEEPDGVNTYNEESVKNGFYGLIEGNAFIRTLLKGM